MHFNNINTFVPRSVKMTFAAAAIGGTLAACTSMESRNAELLDHPEKVEMLQNLKKGAPASAVLDALGIDKPGSMMVVSSEIDTIKKVLYGGNVQIEAPPAELEAFREKMDRYEVWILPYSRIEESWDIGIMTYDTERTGTDNRFVFLFDKETMNLAEDPKLTNKPVNQTEERAILPSMFESIIKRGPHAGMNVMGL
jgi:hypothetical protein